MNNLINIKDRIQEKENQKYLEKYSITYILDQENKKINYVQRKVFDFEKIYYLLNNHKYNNFLERKKYFDEFANSDIGISIKNFMKIDDNFIGNDTLYGISFREWITENIRNILPLKTKTKRNFKLIK
jgi:hypothetical protein